MRIAILCAVSLLGAACRAIPHHATLVYGLPLRAFTKFAMDTSWVRYNSPLFRVRRSRAFLRDWQQMLLAADTLNSKDFGYGYVRLCIEMPAPGHTVFLDWSGGHFLHNGRAYKMSDDGIKVLSRYFPDSRRQLLDPELKKRGRYEHGYHKVDYLPLPR